MLIDEFTINMITGPIVMKILKLLVLRFLQILAIVSIEFNSFL